MSCFFFNDTATTEIYTLSLHDALPISGPPADRGAGDAGQGVRTGRGELVQREAGRHPRDRPAVQGGPGGRRLGGADGQGDRKSTRLNSSHANISYAVFCLKKKKKKISS